METRLLTTEEVAEMLNIPITTMRSKAFRNTNGINAVKVGRRLRFFPQDIEAFIERNMQWGIPDQERTRGVMR